MVESVSDPNQPVASRAHTIGLLLIVMVLSCASAFLGPGSRPQGVNHRALSYLILMVIDWLFAVYVVAGVRRHGGSLRDLIGGRWERPWDFFRDVFIAIGFWIVSLPCLLLVRLAVHSGNGGLDAVRMLAPQGRVETVVWVLLSLTAGFCEELIFRGYLQRQFTAMSGKPLVGILLSAALFGLGHVYQGAKQTIVLGVFGAMFGVLAYRRRSLRPGMMAHAWQDVLAGLALCLLPK